jgi:hypothetical protein
LPSRESNHNSSVCPTCTFVYNDFTISASSPRDHRSIIMTKDINTARFQAISAKIKEVNSRYKTRSFREQEIPLGFVAFCSKTDIGLTFVILYQLQRIQRIKMSNEICTFSADTFSLRPTSSHSYHPNMRRIIVMNVALARACAWAKCFL